MHITIGIKIFGIAVGLLILMAVVALLSMRMTRTVDGEIEESAYARRLLLAAATPSADSQKLDDLRQRVFNAGKTSDEEIAAARQHITNQRAAHGAG